MRQTKSPKKVRQATSSDRLGKNAISIRPPPYGLDFVDQGHTATAVSSAPVQRQGDLEEEDLLQAKFATDVRPMQFQAKAAPAQNRTGLPSSLKSGLEHFSGLDLSSVRVHYNSGKPAQLNAFAYTQGQEIHIGPHQEKHLPHEGWHAVQQMQGRVKPTTQAKGVRINDDDRLEREADLMGGKALQANHAQPTSGSARAADTISPPHESTHVAQRTNTGNATQGIVQRNGWWDKAKERWPKLTGGLAKVGRVYKKHGTWVHLVAEAIGHWILSVVETTAAIAGVVWKFVPAVCQAIIGACKMIRAYMVRRVAMLKDVAVKSYFNWIIAFEGLLGLVAAAFSGFSGFTKIPSTFAKAVPAIASGLASLVKMVRGALGKHLGKRTKGILIVIEACLGIFGNIERAIKATGSVFASMAKIVGFWAGKFVGVMKGARGLKTTIEGDVASGESATAEEHVAMVQHMADEADAMEARGETVPTDLPEAVRRRRALRHAQAVGTESHFAQAGYHPN